MEVQVYNYTRQSAGNIKNCRELSEIDVGLAWQLSPHDPPHVNYTNANQGSRGSFTTGDIFLKGINLILRKSLVKIDQAQYRPIVDS